MDVQTVYAKVKDRLNKWSSDTNQKISKRQFVYAFNKMQLHWFDQRLKTEEVNKLRQEELQQFVKEISKNPTLNKKGNYYAIEVPEDFFYYKRVTATASKDTCEGTIYGFPIEESAVNRYLLDEFQKPSFIWQETFYTIGDNKIRMYYDDFVISEIFLVYYRCPLDIDMLGITHFDKDGTNIDPEIEKSDLEEVIDLTVKLLASDIMDQGRFQTTAQQTQEYN